MYSRRNICIKHNCVFFANVGEMKECKGLQTVVLFNMATSVINTNLSPSSPALDIVFIFMCVSLNS